MIVHDNIKQSTKIHGIEKKIDDINPLFNPKVGLIIIMKKHTLAMRILSKSFSFFDEDDAVDALAVATDEKSLLLIICYC